MPNIFTLIQKVLTSTQHRSRGRLIAAFFVALLIAESSWLANPQPAAAACYWSSPITDTRSAYPPYVSFTSSVTYQIGFTCNGNVNEVYISHVNTTWYVSENPYGFTRILLWVQVRDGNDGDRLLYNADTNIQCSDWTCSMTSDLYPNYDGFLNNGSSGLEARSECENCWVGGTEAYFGHHWFVTGNISYDP